MIGLAGAAVVILAVIGGCSLVAPPVDVTAGTIDVTVENRSAQEVRVEVIDGIVGTVPSPITISQATVPAGQTSSGSMTLGEEWSLLVNGESVYDSLHEQDPTQPEGLKVEVAQDGRVNVVTPFPRR